MARRKKKRYFKKRNIPIVCEHCGEPGMADRKGVRFCSPICSSRNTLEKIVNRGRKKFPITMSLIEEAERNTPLGRSRDNYIARKLGCHRETARYGVAQLGYKWKKRPRIGIMRAGPLSQKYAMETGCVICKESRAVDAAHFVAARHGGRGNVENIAPLCPTHHRLYDQNKLNSAELAELLCFLKNKYPIASNWPASVAVRISELRAMLGALDNLAVAA